MVQVSERVLGRARENIGVSSLERVMRNRNPSLHHHCVNTASSALAFGEAWGLRASDLYTLGVAGLLHDVGQMYWREHHFQAPKPELSHRDLSYMRLHPRLTFNRLRPVDEDAARIAVEHHEWQQNPYPRRRPSQGFNLLSHILILADKFEALMEPRPYRSRSHSLEEASMIVRADYTGSPMLLSDFESFLACRRPYQRRAS